MRETNEHKKQESIIFETLIPQESKQKEFDELMKVPKPQEIDFKTVNDEPFTENMDELINEALEKRKLELNDIVKQYEKVPNSKYDENTIIPKTHRITIKYSLNTPINDLHNAISESPQNLGTNVLEPKWIEHIKNFILKTNNYM